MVTLLTKEDIVTWRKLCGSKTVIAASGCFDFIHPGHVRLLRSAKELGDTLIIGLNSDESIKRLKGPKRPIYPVDDRILMLGSLRYVDAITVFDDDKATNFLFAVKPAIWIKGSDWTMDKIDREELAAVESNGGQLQLIDTGVSWHATALLEAFKTE
jgi:D-beta-D-heptose 7-phosphate kinase/D-beta-D-heptose 1-phosphate adenosyltransferase